MSEPLYVVAIDFDTAFSGYAYCSRHDYQQHPPKVFANENWTAGGQGLLSRKTPTNLLLTSTKEFCHFGYEAENKYNALALRQEHRKYYFYKRFKRKLYGEEDFDEDVMIKDELGKPLPAIHIFSQSIKYLKDYFLKQIVTTGIKIDKSEIRRVLTVPTIWDDSAKFFMRKAAVKAGINGRQLKIALEPEAASIYCQHLKIERAEDASLTAASVGTKYMVIDLGEGTVDITVHEKLDGGKLKELHKASGGAWGGTAVDQRFIGLLTKIVGGPVMHKFQQKTTLEYCEMMREFEVTKRSVTLDSPKGATKTTCQATINVRVPAELDEICVELNGENVLSIVNSNNFPYKGKILKHSDKLVINMEIMQELFMDVVNPIVDHVKKILRHRAPSDVSLIILTGGFAESQIVQEVLKKKLTSQNRNVLVSQEASLSVLKGAVMFGHRPDEIKSRILRYTYGIPVKRPFDQQKHPQSRKKVINGKDYCTGIFHKFITKGTSVEKGLQIKDECLFDNNDRNISLTIYSSQNTNPVYVDEEGCKNVKQIEIKSKLPKSNKAKYSLDLTYTFGDTEVECEILEEEFGFIYNDTLDFKFQ